MTGRIERIVAIGASNLTRGLHAIVATARSVWGPDVEVLAALGHGRSYGAPSTFLVRGLPGILQSGLWRELESHPPAPTRALVTDVGNDIMYGVPPAQILEWVDECVARLQRFTPDVVVTGLPHAAVGGPAGRPLPAVPVGVLPALPADARADDARRRRESMPASRRSPPTGALRFLRLKPEWYGLDPIHIRPGMWNAAWQEILCGDAPSIPGGRATRRGSRTPLLPAARAGVLSGPRAPDTPARRGAAPGRPGVALLKKQTEARRAD